MFLLFFSVICHWLWQGQTRNYIELTTFVAGTNKKPHRMASFFPELFNTFERSRRAPPDTTSVGSQFLAFEKLQLFKVSERSVWKTCFPFFSAASFDFSLPKCKLELEVKGNMLTSSYSVVDPTPTQNEWSQLFAKNDWNRIISFWITSQICGIVLNPATFG